MDYILSQKLNSIFRFKIYPYIQVRDLKRKYIMDKRIFLILIWERNQVIKNYLNTMKKKKKKQISTQFKTKIKIR